MKYDRPVWQIMYECAAAMPEPFRYADVRGFFSDRYPEIGEATIRAHLVGMSEGGRPKHVQFASRAPIFRRLDRGTYAVIPVGERKVDPDLPADTDPGTTVKIVEPAAPAADPDAYFAESAFADARVVPAAEDEDDEPRGPGPADPAAPAAQDAEAGTRARHDEQRAEPTPAPVHRERREPAGRRARTSVTFDDLVRRTGLHDLGSTRARRAAPTTEATGGTGDAGAAATTGSSDDAADPEQPEVLPVADVLLVGSAGERVVVPAPAREMYRDERFQRARLTAQRTGIPWFVVSADAGLLEPHEWMSPDSRTLADADPAYSVAWAQWVAARLAVVHGPLDGTAVHVDAPASYLGPLSAALQDSGAVVSFGAPGADVAQASADREEVVELPAPEPAAAPARQDGHEDVDVDAPAPVPAEVAAAPPANADPATVAAAHLSETGTVLPASELDAVPDQPGLYAWHVDADGARALNRGLVMPFRPGLVYVGQAGAWGLGGMSGRSLRRVVSDLQVAGGRSRSSTFRLTLATILHDVLHLRSDDDPRLTAWMHDHLGVAVWPVEDVAALPDLVRGVVEHVAPPLNLDELRSVEVRTRVSEIRAARA